MTNLERYNAIFRKLFHVDAAALPALRYQEVEDWDSVGHMQLIAELEDTFDIMFDTDDIIDFSSYEKGKELLKKYEVDL